MITIDKSLLTRYNTAAVTLSSWRVLIPVVVKTANGNSVEGTFLNPKDKSLQKYDKAGTTIIIPTETKEEAEILRDSLSVYVDFEKNPAEISPEILQSILGVVISHYQVKTANEEGVSIPEIYNSDLRFVDKHKFSAKGIYEKTEQLGAFLLQAPEGEKNMFYRRC